jgi:catechol-2,3-dioxygenase
MLFLVMFCLGASAQNITLKYVAFNVPDVKTASQWYHNTLGFLVTIQGADAYVSDAGKNFRIKLFSGPTQNNNYSVISFNACHIAIETDIIPIRA